jgi:hypothetical protein
MWVLKLEKFKEFSIINLEFEIFKSPLPHINGFKCTQYVKKICSLLYKKT